MKDFTEITRKKENKKTIYIMRHSITNWNEIGITQGHSQNRLSKRGIELCEKVAKEFKEPIEIIFSSPLMRTMQTSNIMNKYHNVKIVKDERLIEIGQGIFTGRSKKDLTKKELELKANRSKEANMEALEECRKRVEDFAKSLINVKEYNTILVITHGRCAEFLFDALLGKRVGHQFKNAEIKKVSIVTQF